MSSLRVNGVDVTFDSTPVLRNASLSVNEAEVVALLGPSGSGKSTLLRVIAGVFPPDRGNVSIGGSDMTDVPAHRRGVGMVFQDNQLFPHMNVGDNVTYGLRVAGRSKAQRINAAERWLDLVSLHGFGARSIGELSGGEAKRVALARTLATEPSVVLLDEPLTGLDRDLHDRLASDLAALLTEFAITAVLVTHDPEEAEIIGHRSVQIGDINE